MYLMTAQKLAEHYKSDWHAYNLKRRQAGLKLLTRVEFLARLQAAQAARQEQELLKQKQKKSHLKKDKKKEKPMMISVPAAAEEGESAETGPVSTPDSGQDQRMTENPEASEEAEPAEITIDPCQSLYDSHMSASIEENVDYMRKHYSWFLPDAEYLVDLEGLLGYCHEKISIGHMCLQCHQVFKSATAVRMHMLSKQHTQLAYLTSDDQEELAVFFDFAAANQEFISHVDGTATRSMRRQAIEAAPDDDINDDEDDWEDVSDDEDMKDGAEDGDAMVEDDGSDEDDDDLYAGYADQVAKFGFSVTELGELVLPDGRIVGHRSLRRYYKQRPRTQQPSTAVRAAQLAAGERLYNGRVYNVGTLTSYRNNASASQSNALALAKVGLAPNHAAGRLGKGILVTNGPEGSFSHLSVYRYRAAVRKHRIGEQKGQRLFQKTKLNINRMGKKDNRLMNGVSVAHAKR